MLPALTALHDAAMQALERQIEHLPGAAYRLTGSVTYRLPDRPNILQEFIWSTDDYPVLVPLAQQGESAAFKGLQTVAGSEAMDYAPTTADLQYGQVMAMNVPDLRVRSPVTMLDGDYGVVFPRLMQFVMHWIRNNEGPIRGIDFRAVRQNPGLGLRAVTALSTYRAGTA
jgi:uncharacterized protein Usg